jgi:AcrR family transcriptional regulator
MGIKAVQAVRKRVTKDPGVRKRELIDAAVQVFKEKSFARATISDITRAAGVAKGTFYLYFASKEHLLAALKERFVEEILNHASGLYDRVGKDDWWALADATIESFVDFSLNNKDSMQVIVQEGVDERTAEIFAECEAKLDAMFAAAIQAGIEAGAFRVSDPGMIGVLLHHAMDSTLQHSLLYGEPPFDRERFTAAAKELVRKTLAP